MKNNVFDLKNMDSLRELADEVLEKKNKPEDEYEITALLESSGWGDKRAQDTYGFENVFELAKMLWKIIQRRRVFTPFTPMSKINIKQYPLMFFRHFLKGSIFALPMAISVFAMLTIRFSLWSYESFNVEIVTSIAIGTILSFVCIGGFTQAIAKQGYGYIRQGYFNMARQTTFYFVRLGYFLSVAVVLTLVIGNLVFGIFPFRMLILIVAYYFILNAIWLSVTIMYILEREMIFSGLLILGIIIIFVLFRLIGIDIIPSQLIALTFIAILGAFTAWASFVALGKGVVNKGIQPKLPRKTVILNSTGSYFLYGFSYFAYLFTDRVIAWSTDDIYMPFIIWFRGEYELGLDFALLILIIPMGVVEFIVNEMMVSIAGTQKDYFGYEVDKMYKRYFTTYWWRIILIVFVSFFSGILVHRLLILVLNNAIPIVNIAISQITYFVFIVALFGYALTAVGLLNIEILFCLGQPKLANKCVIPALLVNILVGFLLSRWINYYYAVFGLLAGALTFVGTSIYMIRKVLKKIDYYLYVAT